MMNLTAKGFSSQLVAKLRTWCVLLASAALPCWGQSPISEEEEDNTSSWNPVVLGCVVVAAIVIIVVVALCFNRSDHSRHHEPIASNGDKPQDLSTSVHGDEILYRVALSQHSFHSQRSTPTSPVYVNDGYLMVDAISPITGPQNPVISTRNHQMYLPQVPLSPDIPVSEISLQGHSNSFMQASSLPETHSRLFSPIVRQSSFLEPAQSRISPTTRFNLDSLPAKRYYRDLNEDTWGFDTQQAPQENPWLSGIFEDTRNKTDASSRMMNNDKKLSSNFIGYQDPMTASKFTDQPLTAGLYKLTSGNEHELNLIDTASTEDDNTTKKQTLIEALFDDEGNEVITEFPLYHPPPAFSADLLLDPLSKENDENDDNPRALEYCLPPAYEPETETLTKDDSDSSTALKYYPPPEYESEGDSSHDTPQRVSAFTFPAYLQPPTYDVEIEEANEAERWLASTRHGIDGENDKNISTSGEYGEADRERMQLSAS